MTEKFAAFLSILLFINLDFPRVHEPAPYYLTFAPFSFLWFSQGYFHSLLSSTASLMTGGIN